jgi:phage gp46-like protein
VDRDELPDGDTDQGGCWSDLFLDDGQSKGSRLWLLKREKITPETLERAHDYALEALAWLVDEQHVRRVNVSVEHYRANVLAILVEITRTDRSNWHSRQEFSLNGA